MQMASIRRSPALSRALMAHERGQLGHAKAVYQAILRAVPCDPDAMHYLGVIAHQLGQHERAAWLIRSSLARAPHHAAAHANLAEVLQKTGHVDDALSHARVACALEADDPHYRTALGRLLHMTGDIEGALHAFEEGLRHRRLELSRPDAPTFRYTVGSKLRHDAAQLRYLVTRGRLESHWEDVASVLDEVREELEYGPAKGSRTVELARHQRARIVDSYNRLVHREAPGALADGVLAQRSPTRTQRAEDLLAAGNDAIAVFDNLLVPGALAALRQFCLESTIWYDFGFSGHYVGARLEDGLACGLVYQLASELTTALPRLLGDRRLSRGWARMYDSPLEDLDLRAEDGEIVVVLWLTPDEACEDLFGGGLVVHDIPAPEGWDLDEANRRPDRIRDFLNEVGSAPICVPYQQNRAVAFHGRHFHRPQASSFTEGYDNKRVDLTLVFS